MKTSNAITVVAAMAAAVCAAQFPPEPTTADGKTLQQLIEEAPVGIHGGKVVSPEMRELMTARQGGLVVPKGNGRSILFADARGIEGADGFWRAFDRILQERIHIPVKYKCLDAIAPGADAFGAAQGLKDERHPGVVLVTGRAERPVLTIFPEDSIAVVNAGALQGGGKDVDAARLQKELMRSVLLAFGGYASTNPRGTALDNIARPVAVPEDLDAIPVIGFSPNHVNGLLATLRRLDVSVARPVPYIVACKQGWAPAPTNDVQQAIWDKVNSEKERGPANRKEIKR